MWNKVKSWFIEERVDKLEERNERARIDLVNEINNINKRIDWLNRKVNLLVKELKK